MGTIKRFDLKELRNNYELEIFIETGTLYGEGVDIALDAGFTNIISIEIDDELTEKAKFKFKNNTNVQIINGNSFDVLKIIIPTLAKNCLFWLDAHFPGADSHKRKYDDEPNIDIRLPFEKEIEVIFDYRKNFTDVIIADDLWLYEDEELCEIGKFDDHMKRCGLSATREKVLSGRNLDWLREKIVGHYELMKYYQDQGYIVLLPKGEK